MRREDARKLGRIRLDRCRDGAGPLTRVCHRGRIDSDLVSLKDIFNLV